MSIKRKFTRQLFRAAVAGWCIASVASPPQGRASAGSRGVVCVFNPGACTRSMSMIKSVPRSVVLTAGAPTTFNVTVTLFITCPTNNNCGALCTAAPSGAPLTPSSLTMNLYPAAACPGLGSLPPPPIIATISTIAGTMAAPTCSHAGVFNTYNVPVTVPAGTAAGAYCVVGLAQVTFPDGMVLSQRGDMMVCLVDSLPGQPGVPRLSVELITPPVVRAAPGQTSVARYRVVNNDPSNAVTLVATGTSRQGAVRPQGANERQGVFTISGPFGDDFPIQFNPGTNCIPLPPHPYTQADLPFPLSVIPPRGSNEVTVGIRSYGQCANGSCSESTLRVSGVFSDSTPALGCAGMGLMVDTSMPSPNCGQAVNDCNHNGIPDALDIERRISQDRNFNALPDECEQFINAPTASSVTLTNPFAGAPIAVQVAFNEMLPMSSVWANGMALTRTQSFSIPFWVGTIPADTRPGPQTVYFLGKDQAGGLSTYVAPYDVRPQPVIGTLPAGWSTIADNFIATPTNWLSVVLPVVPDGTQLFKWNPVTQSYNAPSTFIAGIGWDPETTLGPGEGAFINSPVPFTFQFNGRVAPAFPQPRPAPGYYLVGCRTPQPAGFEELMEFPPAIGDRVLMYDTSSPSSPVPSSTNTYTAHGWTPAAPILMPGKAAFAQLVAPSPRLFSPTRLGTGAFRFSFSNAYGVNYSVLASSNMALPTSNWLNLGGASHVGGGLYQFTDPEATGQPRRFYLLRSP